MAGLKLQFPRRTADTSWWQGVESGSRGGSGGNTEKEQTIIICPNIWPMDYHRYKKIPIRQLSLPWNTNQSVVYKYPITVCCIKPDEGAPNAIGKPLIVFKRDLMVTILLGWLTPACWLLLQNKCLLLCTFQVWALFQQSLDLRITLNFTFSWFHHFSARVLGESAHWDCESFKSRVNIGLESTLFTGQLLRPKKLFVSASKTKQKHVFALFV